MSQSLIQSGPDSPSLANMPAGDASEQRRRPRTRCPADLTIIPLRDGIMGDAMVVKSEDFSTLGLGLNHDQPLEKGTQFLVPLRKQSGPPLPLVYSVVHCRPVPDGTYQIGAELVSVLDMDEFARRRRPEDSLMQYMSDAVVGETD